MLQSLGTKSRRGINKLTHFADEIGIRDLPEGKFDFFNITAFQRQCCIGIEHQRFATINKLHHWIAVAGINIFFFSFTANFQMIFRGKCWIYMYGIAAIPLCHITNTIARITRLTDSGRLVFIFGFNTDKAAPILLRLRQHGIAKYKTNLRLVVTLFIDLYIAQVESIRIAQILGIFLTITHDLRFVQRQTIFLVHIFRFGECFIDDCILEIFQRLERKRYALIVVVHNPAIQGNGIFVIVCQRLADFQRGGTQRL